MLRRAIVWRWRVLCLSLLMVLVVGVAGYAGSEEKADDGWSVVKQAYAGISEDQLETALAADSLELRATQINFHINPEDIIMEVARYNQAIAFYDGEPITSFLLEKLTQSMGEEAFYDVFGGTIGVIKVIRPQYNSMAAA